MKNFRVLSLGAGVQSSTIYAMIVDGLLPSVDVAIMADTQEEPQAVYSHVDFLRKLGGPEIVTVSAGSLGDNLIRGMNSTGQRRISIPTFLSRNDDGKNDGIGRRQCTKEYKIVPIEAEIRRLLGIERGRQVPKSIKITQVFGLSYDEPKRVSRVRSTFYGRKQWDCEFPLFDEFMTRIDCLAWLKNRFPNIHILRSACVFCPYKSDAEWLLLKETDPDGWQRAIEIDRAIRDKTSICTRGMNSAQYLHRSCQPLELVELKPSAPDRQQRLTFSTMDCEGMCGV